MAKRPGNKRHKPVGAGASIWSSAPAFVGLFAVLGAVLGSSFLSGSSWGETAAASHACEVGLLQKWVQNGGGGLHPSLRIEAMPGTGEQQRHVVARAGAVKAGEPLWHLPDELLLRASGSWAPFRRLRSTDVDYYGRSPFALFAFDDLEPALRTYRLAATLLVERERPGSNWTAYISCLPPQPCVSVFCATDAELEGLQSPTYVAEAQADRAAVERARGAIDWPRVAATHGGHGASGGGGAGAPSASRWRWAVSTVLSRQFVRGEGDASWHELAPLGDLLNHAPDTMWSPMAVKPGRRWSAPSRDVPLGAEVYLRYMAAGTPAWTVLRTYGYVNETQHDVVMMGVNRDFPSPAVAAQVVAALKAIDRSRVAVLGDKSVQAQLAFTARGLDARTLAFCRILQLELGQQAMISDIVEDGVEGLRPGEGEGKDEGKDEDEDDAEGETGAAIRAVFGRLDRAFSGKNEAAALQLMSDGLQALAGEFTTSLAADEAQLAVAEATRKDAGSQKEDTRDNTFLRFRILRKRTVKASQDAVVVAKRKLRSKYA